MSIREIPTTILNTNVEAANHVEPTPSPDLLFTLPTMHAFVGERGKGKTHAAWLYMKYLVENNFVTRLFAIDPTWESNAMLHTLPFQECDIYKGEHAFNDAVGILGEIVKKMEVDCRFHKSKEIYKKHYHEFQEHKAKGLHYSDMARKDRMYMEAMQNQIATQYEQLHRKIEFNDNNITPADMFMAENIQFPEKQYGIVDPLEASVEESWPIFFPPYEFQRPHGLIFIDDMSHSPIYSTARNNPMVNLALRHRHVGGQGYGVTILFLVQTFKTGVPKALRCNVQQFSLFQGSDIGVLENMYEEFGGLCTKETFFEVYRQAIGTDPKTHNFLTVDKNAKDPDFAFRRNFDTFLIPQQKESGVDQLIRKRKDRDQENNESNETIEKWNEKS